MVKIDLVEMGERIKNQRQMLGMTRDDLSQAADISERFCYDIELGLKKTSLQTLCKICDSLKISLDYAVYGRAKANKFDAIISILSECPESKIPYIERMLSYYYRSLEEL